MAQIGAGRENGAQGLGLKFQNTARGVAWFVFAVTPLGLLTGFLSHDVIPKVIVLLCGAAALLLLQSQWTEGIARLGASQRGRWFLWLCAAQASVLALSTLFSKQPLLSLAGTTWRRFGMVEQGAVLVIVCAVASLAAMQPGSVVWLWRAVVACAGVASIYGIAQYFGLDPVLDQHLYAIDYLGGVVRPPGTMGHAIYYSSYLAPIALMAAWQAGAETNWKWAAIHTLVAALAPLAILLSGSRGALLGWVGGGAVLLFYKRPSQKWIAAGAAGVLAVGAFVAFAPMGASLRTRIAQWRGDPGSVRLAVWRESPRLIAEAPLLGWGPETFAGAFRRVESAELSRAYPDFINETPHNALIDAACEEGLAGALILAGVFALGVTGKGFPELRAALAAVLICGLFASFSLVSDMYCWGLAGLSAAGVLPMRAVQKKRHWWTVGVPLSAAFIAFAFVLAVQDWAYGDLGAAVEARDLPGAKSAFVQATSFGVGLPGYELWGSQQLSKLKAWDEALDAATLAEDRGEDRAGAAYQSAILAIVKGDAAGADARASEAILLAPNWYKPHLLRAQVLQAVGRNEESANEARTSMNLGWKGK